MGQNVADSLSEMYARACEYRGRMAKALYYGYEKLGNLALPAKFTYFLPLISYFNNHLAMMATGLSTRLHMLSESSRNGDGWRKAAADVMVSAPLTVAGMRAGYALSSLLADRLGGSIPANPEKLADAAMATLGYCAASKMVSYARDRGMLERIVDIAERAVPDYRRISGELGKGGKALAALSALVLSCFAYPYVSRFNEFVTNGESIGLVNALSSYLLSLNILLFSQYHAGKVLETVRGRFGDRDGRETGME